MRDLGPVQHLLAPVKGETCSIWAFSPPGWLALPSASVSLCPVDKAPWQGTQLCPGKPSPGLEAPRPVPYTQSSDPGVAGWILVADASFPGGGIMKAWTPLEAAQVTETREREVPGLLGASGGEARPYLWVGMSRPPSKTHVPAPHSARPLLSA